MVKNIAILGSTGSIGTQTLEVISQQPDSFKVEVLSAHSNAKLLIKQSKKYKPNAVVIQNESFYKEVFDALNPLDIKVFAGEKSLEQIVEMSEIDMVLTAIVGYAGLKPTINAIKAKKPIALANKETLVVAGDYITKLAIENRVPIIPVDSEHSAIFQCLAGEADKSIEKLILTASGGPFRGKTSEFLRHVKPEQALKHPNWTMGAKITIDSASLMNKGLEVIEAHWLFGIKGEDIEVVVHPESIIHSLVQFHDGALKAQLGLPEMNLPIQYALGFPNRLKTNWPRFSFFNYPQLNFEKPDLKNFRNLALAYQALKIGGNMPCILNAANEIAVQAFLTNRIGFLEISDLVEYCMEKVEYIAKPSIEEYFLTDEQTRVCAANKIK